MKKFIDYIKQYAEYNNNPSSKRLVGLLSGLSLIVYMFIYPSDGSNNSVLILSLGALGISGVEKIYKK